MNDLQVTEKYTEAVELHKRIMTSGQIMASALLDFCQELKEMRDKCLYEELGYTDFDSYVEGAVGIKKRMAYNYIQALERNGPVIMSEHASIGITKLQLIAQLSPTDRDEVISTEDLATMSAAEVKELVAKYNKATEQLNFLQEENKALKEKEPGEVLYTAEDLQAAVEKARLEAESQTESNAESYEDLKAQAEQDARKELEALHKRELADAQKKAKEAADAALQKKIDAATKKAIDGAKAEGRKEAEKAAEDLRQQVEAAAKEKEAAEERAAQLEKKLELAASTESTAFALYFDQLQQAKCKMDGLLEQMQQKGQAEQAEKLRRALKKALTAILEGMQ